MQTNPTWLLYYVECFISHFCLSDEEVQLADLSEDGAVIVQHLPKFLEGHAIQLEDGTTAILPTGVKEGLFLQMTTITLQFN